MTHLKPYLRQSQVKSNKTPKIQYNIDLDYCSQYSLEYCINEKNGLCASFRFDKDQNFLYGFSSQHEPQNKTTYKEALYDSP